MSPMVSVALFCDSSSPRADTVFSKNPHITWPASSTGSLSLKELLNSLLARLTEVWDVFTVIGKPCFALYQRLIHSTNPSSCSWVTARWSYLSLVSLSCWFTLKWAPAGHMDFQFRKMWFHFCGPFFSVGAEFRRRSKQLCDITAWGQDYTISVKTGMHSMNLTVLILVSLWIKHLRSRIKQKSWTELRTQKKRESYATKDKSAKMRALVPTCRRWMKEKLKSAAGILYLEIKNRTQRWDISPDGGWSEKIHIFRYIDEAFVLLNDCPTTVLFMEVKTHSCSPKLYVPNQLWLVT